MKKTKPILAALAAAFVASASIAHADPGFASRTIAPGIVFTETESPGTPLVVTAVKFHPSTLGVKLRAFVANDAIGLTKREMVSSAVARTGAVAGTNGDFFPWTADPLGLTIVDGRLTSEPWPDRPVFGVKADGTPMIGIVKMSLTIRFDSGLMLKPNGIDRPATAGEMVVYEKFWGTSAPPTPDAAEMVLRCNWKQLASSGRLKAEIVSALPEARGSAVPDDGVVVIARGPRASEMLKAAEGQKSCDVQLVLQDEEGRSWLGVTECVGGEPMVLKGGEPWTGDGTQGTASTSSFSTTRHPRTAAGITRNGSIILVVVDGRQVTSRGASLKELAQVMSNLGCTDAVNLDGGGSSTMIVRGLVVNSPSDGQQRLVASGLLVMDDRQSSPGPEALSISPSTVQMKAGDTASLSALVGGSPMDTADASGHIIWGTANGGVFVDQQGRARAVRSGSFKAGAYLKGGSAFADVSVTAAGPGKLALTWDEATPADAANRKLKIAVRDALGNVVPFAKVTLVVTGGTPDTPEVACGPDGIGSATLTWDPAASARSVAAASGDVQSQLSN